jgi:putative transcriptional regulator
VKRESFEELIKSVRQAGKIHRGEIRPSRVTEYAAEDIKGIRNRLKKSQSEFAAMIGVSTRTLQNWEQGHRTPVGPARALLRVAARNPKAVAEALGA